MPLPKNPSRMRRPSPNYARTVAVPPPRGGINALQNLAEQTPEDAVFMINMIPAPSGATSRTGYREWATNVGTAGLVRTIIPFVGSAAGDDRLFACAANGIYDVSNSTAAPTLLITFLTIDDDSGRGVWQNFVNTNGDYFVLYTDETNGYYVYTETAGTWAKIIMGGGASQISGTNPVNFVSVLVWKSRVWFVEKNSGRAWYTAVGALYGAVTSFNFGNKFQHGGDLRAQYNWSVDGGEGVDDYLVSVSGGGDVILYKGTDPASASTFDQRGQYFIGPPPAGRRLAAAFGGELYLLSSFGIIPLTQLLSGQVISETATLVTRKITPLVNTDMQLYRDDIGWEIRYIPTQNLLMVTTPKQTGISYKQYVQNLDTQGWAFFRDFPVFTGDTWHGFYYHGTEDGIVYVHTGDLDNVLLDDDESGDEIDWSVLTSYQDYDLPAANRVAQMIRCTFLAALSPAYVAVAKYDYDMSEPLMTPILAPALSGSLWDVALWDVGLWGGSVITINPLRGANGLGRSMAIWLRGNSRTSTTWIRSDITAIYGNVL